MSFVYTSFIDEMVHNDYLIPPGTYKVMFVTERYAASRDHSRRSDVTDEIVGEGYTTRGWETSIAMSQADNRPALRVAPISLGRVNFRAYGAVIYRSNGGRAVNDELVAYLNFNGTFVFRGSFDMSFGDGIVFG